MSWRRTDFTPACKQKRTDETGSGVIVGTAPYMSPEQARGESLDPRSDIWAFGCVLYEMLSGTRAFPGGTAAEAVAAVLEREPDWKLLPEGVPERGRVLIAHCLSKDRARRLHDIADARIQLEDAPTGDVTRRRSLPATARRRALLALAALLAVLVTLAGYDRLRRAPPETIRSIAILPLENLSGDPSQEYLADGMTEALIS